MIEGLKKIYSGNDALNRHITLFSLCGIVGLADVYALTNGIVTFNLLEQFMYILFFVIFAMFIIGYEIEFLKQRELPDVGFGVFKHLFNVPIFIVVLITIGIVLTKPFPQMGKIAFLVELLLAVPITMIQAGYSYNPKEAFSLFPKFTWKNYFVLLIKRFGIILLSYVVVSLVVFMIFFLVGTGIAIYLKGDVASISLTISSFQFAITKLTNFITGILLVYVLTIATLAWDYDLIKTYES